MPCLPFQSQVARYGALAVRALLLLWGLGAGCSALAAGSTTADAGFGDRNLRLTHQTLGFGESSLAATDVLQDADGFIWIGTEDGLFRLSGAKLDAFSHSRNNPRTLIDDHVVDLHLDADQQLWVATEHGLHRYDKDAEQFERFLIQGDSALAAAQLSAVHADSEGLLWVGTETSGLFAFGPDQQVQHFTAQTIGPAADTQGLPSNHITTISSDSKGNLWIGTNGGGLARFDRRTDGFVSYQKNNSSIASNRITRVYEDPKGMLWIGTLDAGLLQFDQAMQSFSGYRHDPEDANSLSSNHVTDMLVDHAGSFWIATNNGLNEFKADAGFARYLADPVRATGLRSNALQRLHLDADGVLWIATDQGVNRWNYLSDAFRYLGHGTQEYRISAATECPDGQLWLGTRNQGIGYLHRASGQLRFVSSPAQQVRAMLCDSAGTLWIGSADRGLLRADTSIAEQTPLPEPVPATSAFNSITSLQMDDMGTLWVGTASQGLISLTPGLQDTDTAPELVATVFQQNPSNPGSLPDNQVRTLFIDQQQQLWIGLQNGILARLDRKESLPEDLQSDAAQALSGVASEQPAEQQAWFTPFELSTDNGRRAATDLLQSKNGDLWITTNGGGLLRWPVEQQARGETRFTHFTKASGLPSDYLRAVLEDQNGQLWISSTRGLVRFDPTTLKMRQFDSRNGLRGDRFFSGSKLVSRSGQLYFGGQQGLTGFYPSAIGALKTAPRLTLSAHNRDGQLTRTFSGTPAAAPIQLNAGTDYVQFQFEALQYIAPEQNRFQYQLKGFDSSWHEPGASLSATYTGLPAGDYLFMVRAANPDGLWNDQNTQLAITVAPPAWRSTTAYVLYGVLATLAFGYMLFSWRREVERLRTSRRNLELQVEHRTNELEERNRQLQELNLKLQEASITDPLTGLLNRRSFYEFVSREVARVERSYTGVGTSTADGKGPDATDPNRRCLFFMMIDLDAFKPINDTFGHHTGDHTLVQVSDLLRACARDADTVFRWGGDEFLVIGQVHNEKDMELLAERFRKAIAEHRFDPKYGKALRLSASIGVAPYPFCANNPGIAAWEQVADVADLAAYLAKTHGKNAWVSARGADDLNAMQMQRVKDNFELLIETQKIVATSSDTHIPIPGASRTE
ncbi:MAG: two-component regulator propeller domain-containing protein [Pseudomonadales bacterium]